MSKKSPAWAHSSPFSSASSSGYYSTGSSSMSSREKTPKKSCKRKSSETKVCPIPGLDLQTTEEFFKAEEELRFDHLADFDIFIDVPEVHPDYNSNFQTFMDQFSKRFGDDPVRCKELWETFWYEIIKEKKEQEWKIKRAVLIKQFQIKSLSKEKHKKQRRKDSHSGENKNERSEKIKNEVEPGNIECITLFDDANENCTNSTTSTSASHNQCVIVPSSTHHIKERMPPNGSSSVIFSLGEVSDKGFDQNVSLSYSLDLLDDVCDSLGDIVGSVFRRVIRKMKDLKSVNEILKLLDNKDTKKLLQWASGKLKSLSTEAVGAERSKFIHCSKIAVKLIEYGTEGMWNEKYGGLDVNQVAEATYNKDVPATLAIIKESLRYSGINNPTTEVVNNMFSDVSACHLKIALGN